MLGIQPWWLEFRSQHLCGKPDISEMTVTIALRDLCPPLVSVCMHRHGTPTCTYIHLPVNKTHLKKLCENKVVYAVNGWLSVSTLCAASLWNLSILQSWSCTLTEHRGPASPFFRPDTAILLSISLCWSSLDTLDGWQHPTPCLSFPYCGKKSKPRASWLQGKPFALTPFTFTVSPISIHILNDRISLISKPG